MVEAQSGEAPIFDADNHYYEARDAFTRHLGKEWRLRAVCEAVIDGRIRHIVGGRLNFSVQNPTFDPIIQAGALKDYFRGNPDGKPLHEFLALREPLPAHYQDRDARLRLMDEQGLQAIWLLPTLGVAYEEYLKEDPAAAAAAFRAFNRWLEEDWGFASAGRIFAAPYLAFGDRDSAAEEIDWAIDRGARIFVVRPAPVLTPVGWRAPGDPYFDNVWGRLHDAGVTLVVHVADVGGYGLDGYVRHGFAAGGLEPASPLEIVVGHDRPVFNYLASVVCDRLFERFPNLRLASVENGAQFLPSLLAGLARVRNQRPGFFREDPVETFKRHVWINPFWEDDLEEIVSLVGPDRVIFGSDWPHAEGLPHPLEYLDTVKSFDEGIQRKVMFENADFLTRRFGG